MSRQVLLHIINVRLIGVSMIALSALVWLPHSILCAFGLMEATKCAVGLRGTRCICLFASVR
ncbi:conserved protein of unknown function [Pseudomonas marincola]|uniref:Uncharacterized protein n=1 Tax=Pseudomonas marincola TaxID=437900 RepID=A0A653E9Q5_9PSED|nr:conserved protein of unknown function [Pseudomonas marincola]